MQKARAPSTAVLAPLSIRAAHIPVKRDRPVTDISRTVKSRRTSFFT
ncbi:MAG: hypothetical protein LBF77_02460 [Spirochaetaceae bacterium]|jgi:hypothetical protein|nr:hypothetical protein [Spirochaetaceae bacterium]